MPNLGYAGLLGIILSIVSIGITWWALQAIRIDIFTHNPKGAQVKVLQIILSVVIGYQLTKFLLDYLGWSFNIKFLL